MIRLERVERIGEGKLFFRKVFPPQTPPLPFQRLLTLSNPCSQYSPISFESGRRIGKRTSSALEGASVFVLQGKIM